MERVLWDYTIVFVQEATYFCGDGGKRFDSQFSRSAHRHIHTEEQALTCDECVIKKVIWGYTNLFIQNCILFVMSLERHFVMNKIISACTWIQANKYFNTKEILRHPCTYTGNCVFFVASVGKGIALKKFLYYSLMLNGEALIFNII